MQSISLKIDKTLLCLLVACVLVRLPWMFVVPMQEAPDEFAHYWVINFIKEHWRLPGAAEVYAGGPSAVYGSLPQLGYIPHVLCCFWTSTTGVPFYERFGSVLAGLVTVFAAYKIGREIFARQRKLSFLLPAVIVFHPQLVFVNVYANNDATTCALAGLVFYFLILNIKYGLTIKRSFALGALVAWLTLSKFTGWALFPVIGLATLFACFINQATLGYSIACLAIIGTTAGALSGWWFFHNWHEFNGDLLGTKTMYKSWATTFHEQLHYHLAASHIIKDKRWWRTAFFSFWGLFGYMTRYIWRPAYYIYLAFTAIAAVGWLNTIGQWLRRFVPSSDLRVESKIDKRQWKEIAIWSMLILAVVSNIAAMIWSSMQNFGGAQGRYLFPCEIPVQALLLLGLFKVSESKGEALALGFLYWNIIACVGSWLMLFLACGFHASPL